MWPERGSGSGSDITNTHPFSQTTLHQRITSTATYNARATPGPDDHITAT
ncbi:hypothetical protein [Xylella fastidiosa]|uniref:Uncharacterized protein n=1 Tax=Xylella fastidiosa subsp. fastidiosa TaxID=644356 RepID=A0AAJ5R001_XYLFS|nr:hypothetical protein [Xylella fastidiosa]WCF27426.1 hypothetical protein OK117_07090 [Xylella fastidiosa subsp. fastidiosa]